MNNYKRKIISFCVWGKSDLYNPTFHNNSNSKQNELLFKKENFDKFNPNTENLGYLKFNNCTRQQLRNVTKNNCS